MPANLEGSLRFKLDEGLVSVMTASDDEGSVTKDVMACVEFAIGACVAFAVRSDSAPVNSGFTSVLVVVAVEGMLSRLKGAAVLISFITGLASLVGICCCWVLPVTIGGIFLPVITCKLPVVKGFISVTTGLMSPDPLVFMILPINLAG